MDQQVGQHGQLVVRDEFGAASMNIAAPAGWCRRCSGATARSGGSVWKRATSVDSSRYPGRRCSRTSDSTRSISLVAVAGMRLACAQVISRLIRKKCSKSPSPSEWCSARRVPWASLDGAADDVHDRHVLGVTARDRVGCREFADAECGYHS